MPKHFQIIQNEINSRRPTGLNHCDVTQHYFTKAPARICVSCARFSIKIGTHTHTQKPGFKGVDFLPVHTIPTVNMFLLYSTPQFFFLLFPVNYLSMLSPYIICFILFHSVVLQLYYVLLALLSLLLSLSLFFTFCHQHYLFIYSAVHFYKTHLTFRIFSPAISLS